jgi:hypothetical protein
MNLYDEFINELKKLTGLVLHAQENNQSFSLDQRIIEQSRKVDLLVEKITSLQEAEKSKGNHMEHE